MPPEGENIESIRNAKRKAAELADTTLSLINSEALDAAASYYLKALEEVGKIKILQAKLGNEIGTFVENTRDLRIQAALLLVVAHFLFSNYPEQQCNRTKVIVLVRLLAVISDRYTASL